MTHLFFCILMLCAMMIFFLIILNYNQKKNKKLFKNLDKFLNKNLSLLVEINKKKIISDLNNSIQIYSKFQIIQKVSNANFVSFFTYDHSKKFIDLNFMFSIDNDSKIIQDSIFNGLSITGELLAFDILKSGNDLLINSPLK